MYLGNAKTGDFDICWLPVKSTDKIAESTDEPCLPKGMPLKGAVSSFSTTSWMIKLQDW